MLSIHYLIVAVVFFYGAMTGSLVGLICYRLPRKMPILVARSICESCRRFLSLRDLIPIFGWLLNRGRCRFCHAPVKARYSVIELVFGVVFVVLYLQMGLSPEAALAAFSFSLAAVVVITFVESRVVLKKCLYTCVALSAWWWLWSGGW